MTSSPPNGNSPQSYEKVHPLDAELARGHGGILPSEENSSKDFNKSTSPEDFLKQHGSPEVVIRGEFSSSDEERVRFEQQAAEAKLQRQIKLIDFIVKDIAVYAVGIILVFIVSGLSINVLGHSSSSLADKEWAQRNLAVIGSIVAGYVFGRSSKTLQQK